MMETSFRQSATCDIIEYISSMESDHWEAQIWKSAGLTLLDSQILAGTHGRTQSSSIEEFIARHPLLEVSTIALSTGSS